ncbi:MAG TPA: TetR/AcrR family transcriptional regulator [Gemmatimonadales bacterium]
MILAAATDEFSAHGLAGARVERIARQAGVNKQLLFYYFGSKVGLHRAVVDGLIEHAKAKGEDAPTNAGPADTRLRQAILGLLQTLDGQPHLVRLCTQLADPRGGRPFQQALTFLAEPVRRAVLAGQRIGLFRDDADPDYVADLAVSAVVGHLAASSGPDVAKPPAAWGDALADLLIRGLAW